MSISTETLSFPLSDLLQLIPPGYIISDEPYRYEASHFPYFTCHTSFTTNSYLVDSSSEGTRTSYFNGFRRQFLIGSEEVIKIRHDFVANLCTGDTDVKFKDIDPNYDDLDPKPFHNMSPDFFDLLSFSIMELGTNASDEWNSMVKTYNTKHLTYTNIAKDLGLKYFIMIVGPTKIITNYPLEVKHVNEICARMRFGLNAEASITESQGADIFKSQEQQAHIKMVTNVLSSIKRKDFQDPDYNTTDIYALIEELNEEEIHEGEIKLLQILDETAFIKKTPRVKLEEYLSSFTPHLTHPIDKLKRVTNFPFIISFRSKEIRRITMTPDSDMDMMPSFIATMWRTALSKENSCFVEEEEYEKIKAESGSELNKHINKKRQLVNILFTDYEKLELAKRGVGAKEYEGSTSKNAQIIKEAQMLSHKGFHPAADTEDIEEYMSSKILTRRYREADTDNSSLISLLSQAKNCIQKEPLSGISSVDIFKDYIYRSEIACFGDLISCIMEEIAISVRHYTNNARWLYKELRYYDVGVLIKNTGSHIFFSLCYKKSTSSNIDTGRLGPSIFESENYWYSDIISMSAENIEHYSKAGPYIGAIMAHFMSACKLDISSLSTDVFYDNDRNAQFWRSCKFVFLLYLNNKLDAETILTSQRYFFMNILDEINPNPYLFTERLPDILRSRLSVYILKQTVKNMDYYAKNGVEREIVALTEGQDSINYLNLRPIFLDEPCSLEFLIDSFYFGYVVTKNRDMGVSSNYIIVEKLLKEEYKYLDLKAKGDYIFDDLEKPSSHRVDRKVFRLMIHMFDVLSAERMGVGYKSLIKREILDQMANSTFTQLATLKASAKHHKDDFILNEEPQEKTAKFVKDYTKRMKEKHKEEFSGRPKVLLALTNLADKFEATVGPLSHIIQILPWCLEKLENQGFIDCDMFSKSQHGGPREITVFEITARVVQYFIELISKTICKKYKSEAITHPEEKSKFVSDHYKQANVTFGQFYTMCKSSDAGKWCQNHWVSKFCALLLKYSDPLFHNFIIRALYLWTKKRISLPADLIIMFKINIEAKSENKMFMKIKQDFREGNAPFCAPFSGQIVVESGMLQGMLHYLSSLYHTVLQEVMAGYEKRFFEVVVRQPMIVTKIQGSDDSGSLNSIPINPTTKQLIPALYRMMLWKEHVGDYISIFNSKAKTAIGIMNLIEYNSEWFLRTKSIKPTFRWVSACLETTVAENFITRYRIFSNTLTQTLEGGASTLECSLIQLCQAWMHYKLIGLDSHLSFPKLTALLGDVPDPSAGFFPLDHDMLCGITGMEFALYSLAKSTDYGSLLAKHSWAVEESVLDFEGNKDKTMLKSLQEVKISFNKGDLYKQILKKGNVEEKEVILNTLNDDPYLVFKGGETWKEDKLLIAMKIFSPGVRDSLNGRQPLIRMLAASAYILNKPCFRMAGKKEKYSLIDMLQSKKDFFESSPPPTSDEKDISLRSIFTQYQEYELYLEFIHNLSRTVVLEYGLFSKRNKVTLEVFHPTLDEPYSIIAMCKRQWFQITSGVKTGKTVFNELWTNYKVRYPFLRDTFQETSEYCGLKAVHLKFFLEGLGQKIRKVVLSDTSGKSMNVFSTVTRIYWPNTKLRSTEMSHTSETLEDLRSNIYATLNFILTEETCTRYVKEMIKECSDLSKSAIFLPKRMQILKLIHEFLNHPDKRHEVLEAIRTMKAGILGFFTIRQKFNARTKEREGQGQWRGIVSGVPCIINLEGKIVKDITIKSIAGIDYLGYSLKNLIREMKSSFPIETLLSPSKIYLGPRGNIYASLTPEVGIPIKLDSTMQVDFFDNMLSLDWDVAVTDYSVRLIVKTPWDDAVITLISDIFSPKDWNPSASFYNCPDDYLEKFHSSTPISLNMWLDFGNLLPLKTSMGQILNRDRVIKRLAQTGILGHYDMRRFGKLFLAFVQADSEAYKDLGKDISDLLPEFNPQAISKAAVEHFIEGAILKNLTLNIEEEETWASSLDTIVSQRHLDLASFTDITVSGDEIEDSVRKLYASDANLYEMENYFDVSTAGMSRSNRWLSLLSEQIYTEYGRFDFNKLKDGILISFPGLIGKILTLVFRRDMEEEIVFDESEEEDHFAETIDYSITDNKSHNVSERRQQEKVEAYREWAMRAEGKQKQVFTSLARKEERTLLEMGKLVFPSTQNVISKSKDKMMKPFLRFFSQKGLIDVPDYEDNSIEEQNFMYACNYVLSSKLKERKLEGIVNSADMRDLINSIFQENMSFNYIEVLTIVSEKKIVIWDGPRREYEGVPIHKINISDVETLNFDLLTKSCWIGEDYYIDFQEEVSFSGRSSPSSLRKEGDNSSEFHSAGTHNDSDDRGSMYLSAEEEETDEINPNLERFVYTGPEEILVHDTPDDMIDFNPLEPRSSHLDWFENSN